MSQTLKLYDPKVKIFYGSLDDSACRLIPAPTISISTEFVYSNDTIIGYTYIITLNGQVTALDLRDFIEPSTYNKNYDFGAVIDHLHKMRNILSKNGNVLHVVEVDNNTSKPVLTAKGGILRSFDFSESNNQWTKYANYSAQIEFHSLELKGAKWKTGAWQPNPQEEYASATEGSEIFLNDKTYPYNDNTDIVNIKNFKIKSFQDSWSFSFDNDGAFNKVNKIENDSILNIDNTSFQIQYTINAVGKNFYTYDNDEEENKSRPKIIPAWEQAKNFVQYRLHAQVTGLLDHVLENQTAQSGCDPNMLKTLQNAHAVGASNGLLKNIGDAHFMVFNEQISCETSESEGSFSATYSAIVKSSANSDYSLPEARHTIRKNITTNRQGTKKTKTISLEGTIEGLIEGGLIRHSKPLVLPQKGSILIFQNLNNDPTKYDNAKKLLDKIYDEDNYNSGFGVAGKRDLKIAFKNALGITEEDIGQDVWSEDERGQGPHPLLFNLTHNYKDGSISYSLEYSSDNISGRKYREISISTKNPTKVIATFSIPNSENCGIIQELGTYTTKTVSVSIRGIDLSPTGKYNIENNDWLAQLDCMTCYENGAFPVPLPDDTNIIVTNKTFTKNPMDGSFTLNLEYICKPGCAI
jgi:hypothetical protein